MDAVALALSIVASVLSLGSFVIGIYNLIKLQALLHVVERRDITTSPLSAEATGRTLFPGGRGDGREEDLGMPDVYDPEDELDAAVLAEQLGV